MLALAPDELPDRRPHEQNPSLFRRNPRQKGDEFPGRISGSRRKLLNSKEKFGGAGRDRTIQRIDNK
jgi:hypothetical protein